MPLSTSAPSTQTTSTQLPTFKIYEDFDKIIAKEVYFTESGEKRIARLLHFPNITPSEQNRLLMSDSGSGQSDDEVEQVSGIVAGTEQPYPHKSHRKKSSSKRSLDMQRKISLNKLSDIKKEINYHQHPNQSMPTKTSDSSTPSSSPSINCSVPLKHNKTRSSVRNGKMSSGYEQYQMSLLTVPMSRDYCDPSSDDLSSEWDSDVPEKGSDANNKESKVKIKFYCVIIVRISCNTMNCFDSIYYLCIKWN